MCYPVCGMVHIKEPLLLIGKSSPLDGMSSSSSGEDTMHSINNVKYVPDLCV